jgi:hypothetical protein
LGAFTDSSQDLLAGIPDPCGSLAVMDNMHEPPSGSPQENWPTQEIGPSAGQPGPEGWGQPSAQPGYGPGQEPAQGWDQGPRLVGPEQGWSQPSPRGPGWAAAGPGESGGPGWAAGGPGASGGPGWPGGAGGPGGPAGPGGPSAPARRPAGPRRHSAAVWWGAGLALVLLLAGGGAAAAELTSSSSAAPAAPTGQAAQLNTLLNSSSSLNSGAATLSSSASNSAAATPCLNRAKKLKANGHPFAARTVLRLCGHRLRRLRLLGGMHGEFTFETKTGPRTISFERGVIESVSGSDIVVQAKDGTTWTWVLESNTVIRQGGQRATASTLSDGEHVFAGGPVISGGYDARLIVVKPSSGGSSPSPTPSPATGS